MNHKWLPCLLLLAATAVSQAQAPADRASALAAEAGAINDTAALERAARTAVRIGDSEAAIAAWKRLTEMRPHLGRYKLELAAAYAAQDDKSASYNALLELQAQGYAFDIGQDPRFAKVATTEAWKFIVQGLDANRAPFGEGEVAWTLPAQDLLIDALAWDPTGKQLLVGSARSGAVYAVGRGGQLRPLVQADADNGMWAVFDLAVDAGRGVLWVASTAVPHFRGYDPEQDLGRAGVFRFDLRSGRFVERFLSPSIPGQSFFISSLALAPDGTVYAADGVNNAVYSVGKEGFRRLFHAPSMTSIRGMAVSGDGGTLYFADHELGILGFDLASGKPFDVRVPRNLALGGIDGMEWWQGHLIVVQNRMQPSRVMRLQLSSDGRSIAGVVPLEANKPALTFPTASTLAGDSLYLIANSPKRHYDRFGALKTGDAPEATRIYRLQADFEGAQPKSVTTPIR
ncbi:MAG TPA: hypothetical protein VFG21_06610 [Xanthomonadaceae bacterium]|nr:hypothetical protein [Xanthomonadaceae bacterium]